MGRRRQHSDRRGTPICQPRAGPGYELEEVILASISVRVERDSKAKQKHLPPACPCSPSMLSFP